jgi:hypothetical protein
MIMKAKATIAPLQVGDTVTIITYTVPTLESLGKYKPRIQIKKNVEVTQGGAKQYVTATGRKYSQDQLGIPIAGMFHNQFVIALPTSTDDAPYIQQIIAGFATRLNDLIVRMNSHAAIAQELLQDFTEKVTLDTRDERDGQ